MLISSKKGVIATTSRVSIQNQLRMRILYFTENQHITSNTPFRHPLNTHNFIKKAEKSRRFLVIELKLLEYERDKQIDWNKPGINKFK